MSFLDKLKAGVAEAGSKAKTVVEINRLKMVNLSKQSDIQQSYQAIGKLVFEAAESAGETLTNEQLEPHLSRIRELKWEIEQNLQKIANLSETKVCGECGADVAFDARECPKCGSEFEIIDVTDYETDKIEPAGNKELESRNPEA
ncbi:zinc ribbon domain-containing protein [Paenibacillus thailandensis]|uniref:Zinc ribbon domain-containing protein n=1 Tax=Paenibacillus thailandensis TaxID=393250 RepID=A0ABW5QQR9_9BACL